MVQIEGGVSVQCEKMDSENGWNSEGEGWTSEGEGTCWLQDVLMRTSRKKESFLKHWYISRVAGGIDGRREVGKIMNQTEESLSGEMTQEELRD